MHKGVVTIAEFNKPWKNKLTNYLLNHKILKYDGHWNIFNKKHRIDGRFVQVYGSKWLVKFMSWLTDYRGPNAIKHTLKH